MHVTLKVARGVGHLRRQRQLRAIERAFCKGKERFGLHLAHFSVQGDHLHLIVEPAGTLSLSRGMQGLAVRLARALNRLASRTGRVFADRFHAHVLRTRREVANAVRYVFHNFEHHAPARRTPGFVDPCASERFRGLVVPGDPVEPPRTWLLRDVMRVEPAWASPG